MFDDLLQRGFENFEEGDVGCIYINHPALEKPVVVPPRPPSGMNLDVIMDAVEKFSKVRI